MNKLFLALIVLVGLSSSALAQYVVPADGGIAPDGGLNYVFPGGFPFQSVGPLYPMPQQYWLADPVPPAPAFPRPQGGFSAPMSREQY